MTHSCALTTERERESDTNLLSFGEHHPIQQHPRCEWFSHTHAPMKKHHVEHFHRIAETLTVQFCVQNVWTHAAAESTFSELPKALSAIC